MRAKALTTNLSKLVWWSTNYQQAQLSRLSDRQLPKSTAKQMA
ncbi:hypothetical protein [Fischerella sp. PCC 9605]